ncbi:integrator complex subunit 1-like [Rhagoletis pomonella]|uniref:integrator complex subunit 1-like n=1 Tax=Rhagoletis pomonella TaxID=28610 RepID=UPI00177F9D8B|nr:integrator complex subunit 1-like [Rhagoletis pomonella]XP_036342913.1 integrator complex subunit 1-like [Rhagoletis pomonella]
MFQTSPEQSSQHLAEIYKEFLLQREDCLRTLRVFLRELVRVLRYDMNIVRFCKAFMNERIDLIEQVERSEFRDRIFHSMVDIICLCMLLSVSPQIREACIVLRSNKEMKHNPLLLNFYSQMSQIQLEAISWMYETVPNLFKIQTLEYSQALHKILLLDSPEQYSRCDQWPSEPERAALLRIASETPVLEDTLLRIILIGITKDIPLTIPETIDVIMMVIKRASTMRIPNFPAVQANKYDVIDFLFNMVEYHYPENISLPLGYAPPKLAITVLYWKAWIIMLMISAHNPSTFGAFCWKHYPTMKLLIEMCITNQFAEQHAGKEELQVQDFRI